MSVEEEVRWIERTVAVRSLNERAVVSVSGDDAKEWFQGQLSNQVEGVTPGGSVYGFILTLKGRVLADAWVLMREEGAWLDVPVAQVKALLERLDRYIIMEDVDLASHGELCLITAEGPRADELGGGWPTDRLGVGGRTWLVRRDEASDTLAELTRKAEALGGGQIGEEAWARAHVLRGRPLFGSDFGEHTYPQETGLAPVAVSFTKGCYIGQETVVMLQNRGKAPKTLWRWQLEGADPAPPGSPILHDGSNAGEITSSVSDGAHAMALGFVKRGQEPERGGEWTIEGRASTPLGPVAPGVGRKDT